MLSNHEPDVNIQIEATSNIYPSSGHGNEAKPAWHSMLTILGPDAYSDYHKLVCGYLAGKLGAENFRLAISRLLRENVIAESTHNKIIFTLLSFCESSEQRAVAELQKQSESVLIVDETVPHVEPLRPADVHNRFLTVDEKREIRETDQKINSLPSHTPLKPIDLNLQYFNYPLQLLNLQSLPTSDYLRKRLVVHAASKGLRLSDDDDWSDNNQFPIPLKEGTSKMDCCLNIWAKIIGAKSLNS